MASPSDSGDFPTPIRRIPTPLGPNFVPEEILEKDRANSLQSSRTQIIKGHHRATPQATPTTCHPADTWPITDQHPETVPAEDNLDKEDKSDPSTDPPEKFSRSQKFTLFAISFANICSATFYSLLAPFFPTEATNKGATNTEVGIILGVFQAIVFLSSPLFGSYLTTFGPRFVFVTGIFATSTCVILFGMLQWCPPGTIYVVMCLAVRSVEALGAASTTTSSQAIAAHSFSTRLSYVMGIMQACGCIGLMVGPPIGGSLYAIGGFYLPFFVSGGLFMLGGIVSLFMLPPQKVEPKLHGGSKLALLKIPLILIVGYLVAVGQLAMGFIDVALAIHLHQFKLHPAVVGLVFLVAPVVVVILAPLIGWITDKFTGTVRPLMIVGGMVATLGILILGPSPLLAFLPEHTLWLVIVGLVVAGVGWSSTVVCFPVFIKAAHKKGFPDSMETQGLVAGVFNAFNSLGALIGPTVGGFLLQRYKFAWASTMVAGCIFVAALLLLGYTLLEVTICQNRQEEEDKTGLVKEEE